MNVLSMNHHWHTPQIQEGWLDGSSVEGWIAVDTTVITIPARNAIEPIRSRGC